MDAIDESTRAGESASGRRGALAADGMAVIDDLMAGGEMLPAQLPRHTDWSAEKKLAAAVFASAMVEIRDHHGSPAHRRRVAEALEWVQGDDVAWPYSFLRLCDLLALDPTWVREVVAHWMGLPRAARKSVTFLYRQAA
ncbi:MAG: hypothetical protein SF182_07670 [Deltaproteobacteria bacterium]|nr:hypothetical protein [Deltaproteobacteria bacterium]